MGAVDAVELALAAIGELDSELEAWVHVDAEAAREHARDVGSGPLSGLPIGVKDIIDVEGMPTRAGAASFAHEDPTADADIVRKLRVAGAIVLGKTATTEFAYLAPAATRNPWNLEHTPGGSSSGSAAAVASGMVPLALGSQTVGSILRPAAYCGIVGFKPSHGAIRVEGVVPVSRSLDHIGALARSVALARRFYQSGHGKPPTSVTRRGCIAIVRGFAEDRLEPEYAKHLEELRTGPLEGLDFEEIDIGSRDAWFDPGLKVLSSEAASYHAANYQVHRNEYRAQTAELIEEGLAVAAVEYIAARAALDERRAQTIALLADYDALLMPVAPGEAPRGLSSTGDSTFCGPATFAGLPSISLPSGLSSKGLPFGVQLVGHLHGDLALLDLAEGVETRLAFAHRPPHRAASADASWASPEPH